MRRSIFLCLFLLVTLIFVSIGISFDTYAYLNGDSYYSSFSIGTGAQYNRYKYNFYYNRIQLDEKNKNVKFTQDDDYYYFDISETIYKDWTGTNGPIHFETTKTSYGDTVNLSGICIAPYEDIDTLHYNYVYNYSSGKGLENASFDIGTRDEGTLYSYSVSIDTSTSTYTTYKCSETKNSTFLFENFLLNFYPFSSNEKTQNRYMNAKDNIGPNNQSVKNSARGIIYLKNGESASSLNPFWILKSGGTLRKTYDSTYNKYNNSIGYYYIKSVSGSLSYRVAIPKDQIDIYRYCMPVFNEFDASYITPGTVQHFTGDNRQYAASVGGGALDLKALAHCDHNFVRLDFHDRTKHILYCDKCMWTREEAHNYNMPYDNIENDLCECGEKRFVNIHVKDNIGYIDDKFLASPSCDLPVYTYDKTGYTYKYTSISSIVDGNIATSSTIDSICPQDSTAYNLLYDTHSYYLRFNKLNTYDLVIDESMPDEKVFYNERKAIDKTKYEKVGYAFLGWGVMPDISEAIYRDEQEVFNISSDDGFVLNLYPVYKAHSYTVTFSPTRGVGYMSPQHFTYGVEEDIKRHSFVLDSETSFRYWTYNHQRIEGNTSKALEKYITSDNQTINLVAEVYVSEKNEITSYENSPTPPPNKYNKIDINFGPGFNIIDNIKDAVKELNEEYEIRGSVNNNSGGLNGDDALDPSDLDLDDADSGGIVLLFDDLASGSYIKKKGGIDNNGYGENYNKKQISYLMYGALLLTKLMSRMVFCSIIIISVILGLILGISKIRKVLALGT